VSARSQELRAAIVGYGLAGRFFHAPLITATEGIAIAAVVTSNPERQAQAACEHPDALVLSRVDDLWARADDHDLVVVAVANDAHVTLATEAIAHRLAVVVDKPLAPTAAEAEELVTLAEQAEVLLTVFQNRRWDAEHLTLSRLLADGRLGQVSRCESRFERWRPQSTAGSWRESVPPERGGGLLLDLGSHLVDQALVLFGPATHVYAEVQALRGGSADDDAFVSLRHAGGVISHLHASALTAAPGPRLRVLGTAAAFVVAELDGQEDALRSGARPDTAPEWGAQPESSWGRLVIGSDSTPVPSERGAWPRFYSLLVDAMRSGGRPPVAPRDAIAALRVLDAARRSAADGSVVALARTADA
jgi:scyllo-inositol 2-dehydrogenase (NADP+)